MHTFCISSPTSALSTVAVPATVPVVGVEHGDVATLVLQVHLLLQLLQRLVRTHVGVGELCTGRKKTTQSMGVMLPIDTSIHICKAWHSNMYSKRCNILNANIIRG